MPIVRLSSQGNENLNKKKIRKALFYSWALVLYDSHDASRGPNQDLSGFRYDSHDASRGPNQDLSGFRYDSHNDDDDEKKNNDHQHT